MPAVTTLITDPADRLDDAAFDAALEKRYSDAWPSIQLAVPDFADRYSGVCDLVCQLLWPEKYGTDPGDPDFHTSDPARAIARLFFTAAGLVSAEVEH
jgi:hypothetical protein